MSATLHQSTDRVMVIELSHGIWPFTWTRTYRGWCTVWRDAESGARAGTFTESRLADAWSRFKESD